MARTRLIAGKIIRFELTPVDPDTKVPISLVGVTSAYINYYRPNGLGANVSGAWTASIVGNAIVYTTTQGDTLGFDGPWTLAVDLIKNGGPIQTAPIYETLHKPV